MGMFVSSSAGQKQLQRCAVHIPGYRWWWPFGGGASADKQQPLLTLPLSAAITAHNILQDPTLGSGYAWMLNHGVADQRTVVMTYLVVERLKGDASQIAPWLDALPKTCV